MAKYSSITASLLFIAVIIVFAYFLSTTSQKNTNSQDAETSQNTNQKQEVKIGPKLYYFSTKGGVGNIYSYDSMTGKSRIIFTDADEQEKIKSIHSLSSKGVLALMGTGEDSTSGNLYLIDLNESGKKTKLLDNFSNSQPAVISSDGIKLLLVSFDNTEKNYGFQLLTQEIKSGEKKMLVSSSEGFSSFAFDNQGQSVVYSITNQKGSKLYTISVAGGKPVEIYSTNKQCYSLNWFGNKIYFVLAEVGPNTANTAEIYSIFERGGKTEQITKNELCDNYPFVSSRGDLAYFSKEYAEGLANPKESGKIIVSDLAGKNQKEVGQGLNVIGWK